MLKFICKLLTIGVKPIYVSIFMILCFILGVYYFLAILGSSHSGSEIALKQAVGLAFFLIATGGLIGIVAILMAIIISCSSPKNKMKLSYVFLAIAILYLVCLSPYYYSSYNESCIEKITAGIVSGQTRIPVLFAKELLTSNELHAIAVALYTQPNVNYTAERLHELAQRQEAANHFHILLAITAHPNTSPKTLVYIYGVAEKTKNNNLKKRVAEIKQTPAEVLDKVAGENPNLIAHRIYERIPTPETSETIARQKCGGCFSFEKRIQKQQENQLDQQKSELK